MQKRKNQADFWNISSNNQASPSYLRIDLQETCKQTLFKDIFKRLYQQNAYYNLFEHVTLGSKFATTSEEFCMDYVGNYISIVSVESPTNVVLKSR